MASDEKAYVIHGTVTGHNGRPLDRARVVVWWQHIRKREELAAGETSERGHYHLSYRIPEHAPLPVLLVVEARSEHLAQPLVSPLTQAQQTLVVNLSYEPPDQSEWTTLVRAIEPLLEGLTLGELVENASHHDISFLARELGQSTEVIMRIAVSARLHLAYKVSAAAFYAFLRQRVPSSLPSPLLDASQNFTLIDSLVQSIGSQIFALTADVQTRTLTSAVALNLIGAQFTPLIPQIVNELQALRTTDLLNQPYLVGSSTLGQLLDVVALPEAQQQAFAQALATNTQTMRNFWRNLGNGQYGLTAEQASSIERTLTVGSFVKNYVPLVQTLVQRFTGGTYTNLSDLARLGVQDWIDLVNQTGVPPGIDAAGTATPAEVFAQVVYNRVTRAFPTIALASRITTGNLVPETQQPPLTQFFQNNPSLELVKDSVPTYLATQGAQAFSGISAADQPAVIANIRSFQRVLRVAPTTDVSQALLGTGFTSATQIATMGQQQFFLKATAAGLTKPEANQVYQSAAQRHASVISLYMQLNLDAIGLLPNAMGQFSGLAETMQSVIQRDQSLATLFGSQDYCETDDCTSILSPAAYLCDLLMWLRNHQQGAQTALDVLDSRRPDIRHLLLNCPNTDTELPYIDLVIELLADKISSPTDPTVAQTTLTALMGATDVSITVASDAGFPSPSFSIAIGTEILLVTAVGGAGNTTWTVVRGQEGTATTTAGIGAAVSFTSTTNPQWKQTSAGLTAADLSAAPEYFNQGAFVTLFSASYPQSLPYSAGLDELRTYLQQWNLPLWQLRQALLPVAGATVAQQAAVAAERFGMNVTAENLVTTPSTTAAALAVVWNTSDFSATLNTGLATVPVFLQAASITYESLLELLQVAWVQGGLGIAIQGISDTCDTTIQALAPAPLDLGFLDRANRFLRLWLVAGYTMWELDLLLGAPSVGNGVLNQATLVALQAFWQLQNATGLSVDQQLAFYQDIDIATHRDPDGTTTTSLYAQIFLNAAVTWVAPDPDLAALPAGGPIADPVLSDHLAAIQAALGVSAADAATLFALTNNTLTLDNLSLLYRVNALAVASKFAISGLLSVAGLLDPTAASSLAALAPLLASPAATLAFLSQATNVQQSALTLDALTYLLTPPSAAITGGWPTTTQMTQADIAATLLAVQQAVNTLLTASTTLADPMGTGDLSITVVSDTGFPTPNFSVAIGPEILLVTAVSGTGNTNWTVLRGQQGTTPTAALIGATVTPTAGDLTGSIIAAVAANAHTANASPLANDVSALILNTLDVPGATQSLLTVLGDPAFTGSTNPITSTNFPNQFLAIQLFDKFGVLVRGLRLVVTDLTWLLDNAAVYGGLDLTQLPVATTQPALSLSPLLTTLLAIKLARLFTAAPPQSTVQTLYDIIGGVGGGTITTEADAQSALATITGWPAADIAAFAPVLGLAFPASYTQPAVYDALRTLETMAGKASATGVQLVTWAGVPADEPSAEILAAGALGALKGQQPSNAAWLALAPTIMNPIRERQSAALQAYLIGQRDASGNLIYGDADGLFDYFLIDVQMSSCQVTSRVVQAYIAVQIFVERCLMNLEAPAVVVDLSLDDTWSQWEWMSRYRIWEANRQVFLYPENWLIESQRPNRTEIYQTFEQEVRQGQNTTDYLETVVLNYIDRLDGLAHLLVTGTCEDPVSGTIYVVARTLADPPVFYLRSYVKTAPSSPGAWTGWAQIPLDIKASQVVPALYRGRVCLFWLDVKVSNEPQQNLPPAQQSSTPPSQSLERYVSLGVFFSIFRNESWAPAQAAKGKLFDKPLLNTTSVSDTRSVEALYTIKVQTPATAPGYGANLWIDVFRFGDLNPATVALVASLDVQAALNQQLATELGGTVGVILAGLALVEAAEVAQALASGATMPTAVHVGRGVFDGRFSDLELNNLPIINPGEVDQLYTYAQSTYGPDAQPLLPLTNPDPDLTGGFGLTPQAGALAAFPDASQPATVTIPLMFNPVGGLDITIPLLLLTAPLPFRVVGPDTDLIFDAASYFFFQDNRRCYYVDTPKYYWTGSFFSPTVPSDPSTVPYEIIYDFHVFYHPFTRLFWNQLSAGGFDLLYDPNLQQNPDQIDPSGADVFAFQPTYLPLPWVQWDHDDVTGQDRQFLDFTYSAAYSVYNWELFYHIPLYVAQLLSQNQQFEDAQTWFHYIFNPSFQPSDPATDPVPQRFWIPKPLHNLTSAGILAQQITNLLEGVNTGNPTDVAEVAAWRNDPFNPFVLADMRNGVPYMKSTVMSYLDNLIAWGDNLFSTESREALSEATLIYVIADEILGPTPVAVTPPQHADQSFDQLEPILDAFANAWVEIENVVGGAGGGGAVGGGGGGSGPMGPHTFYFKIPPNDTLLGYWSTVADRLYKLRHCQTITGAPLQLALFDAPIDPGLLIQAQAAGVDLSSVLSDLAAALPNYRFTSLYPQALDFVNAVRAYGASLQAALEKSDAGALALLQQTLQQQLLSDGSQVLDWQVQQAQSNIDSLNQTLALAQQKYNFNSTQGPLNAGELISDDLNGLMLGFSAGEGIALGIAGIAAAFPDFAAGVMGFGGTPVATVTDGGSKVSYAAKCGQLAIKALASAADTSAKLAATHGSYSRRQDNWTEAAAEAQIQITQANIQLAGAQLALQIAQQNQTLHQEQIDDLQQQIDFLNNKFTADSLYDWMVGSLSATYFQSYQLAYQMCKQVERCYQFELGIPNSSFIQFGYWDSLYKGLLSGETLNHDLRRMQASYLQQNSRRYELSRYVSLGLLNFTALQQLLVTGACDFTLPESLFDNDYPGQFNRRLTRVSVTVVYPNPGKFDNVKATLTLVANQVRTSTDTTTGYEESPPGSDTRFVYNYAAVPQKIALGNAQDDPGLFITAIASNIADQRYLPFENAGAISSWHLEMPQLYNEVDLSTVGDVVIHLYYTALDGGATLQQTVQAYNTANLPTSGLKVFSAQNDFAAPAPTVANPYPLAPWQAFLATPAAGANQLLTLAISPSKFPAWTRGKTISVTSLTVIAIAWPPGNFVVVPQTPLPSTPVTMTPVAGASEPNVCSATIALPANTPLGTWSFELQQQGAPDFRSLNKNEIGDVLLLVSYQVS
jgi:hypothetical protein